MGGGKLIEFNGIVQNVSKWSKEIGIDESRIRWRIKQGWEIKEVLTTPIRKMPKRLPQSIRKQKNTMRLKLKEKKIQKKSLHKT